MRWTGLNVLLLLFLAACGKKSPVSLTLMLKNTEINYVDSTGMESNYRYKNEEARNKATNIITYAIHNPTNKKYVVILDREYLYPHFSDKSFRAGSIGYVIRNERGNMVPCLPGIADTFDKPVLDCDYCIQKNRIDSYLKLGISEKYSLKIDEYLRYGVTIFPGESRTFKTITMLPIVMEIGENGGGTWHYKTLTARDTFELLYYCNAKEFRSVLPEYLKKELELNNIEIFDGTLISQKIPLRKVKL